MSLFPEKNPVLECFSLIEALYNVKLDLTVPSPVEFFKALIEENSPVIIQVLNTNRALNLSPFFKSDAGGIFHMIKSVHSELFRGIQQPAGIPGEYEDTHKLAGQDQHYTGSVQLKKDEEISVLMDELDNFLESNESYHTLINAAILHGQLERIHPFPEGCGRAERILIHLNLKRKKILSRPVLQVSKRLLMRHREYLYRLEELKKNSDWTPWIKFFLEILFEASAETARKITAAFDLEQRGFAELLKGDTATIPLLKLFNHLFESPVFSLTSVTRALGFNKQTANAAISKLLREKIIVEITGNRRNRIFTNRDFIRLLEI